MPAPRVPRLLTALERTVRRRGDEPALFAADTTLTWRELARRAGGVARRLAAEGLAPGDRVALLLPNGWRFAVALLGGLMAGATVSPLNPMLAAAERARILADLRPRTVLDAAGDETADWSLSLEPRAPALILYTSGSTGRPKGAVLSHAALDAALVSWAGPVMGLTAADCVLATLPLSHSFGVNGALLAPILAGARVALVDPFTPPGVLAAIAQHGVTVFPAVATMFRRLLDAPKLDVSELKTLRIAVSGAAPCPWELAQEWRARTGVRILRGYGMTELFRPISFRSDDARDVPESIGRPVPGVELRIVDDAGTVLPWDGAAVGEIQIRGPWVTARYYLDEDTQKFQDGWLRTGDVGSIDSLGFIQITDRAKDVIKSGGEWISSVELENELMSHPSVLEAAVIAKPDERWTERPLACVVCKEGANPSAEDLRKHLEPLVAKWWLPDEFAFIEAVPKTSVGKFDKKVLRRRLAEGELT